jgi:hypothetical protein
VFVDEMGANTSLCPLYAYSPRGRRAHAKVPRNRGKNTTLLASMTAEGMGPCVAVEGTTTSAVFEAYLEQVLVPTLRPGQVVVLDNLSSHKGSRVRELVESRGCELLFFALLTGPLPHRGGVLKGEGAVAADRSTNARGPYRNDGTGAGRGDEPGRPRILRALRLPLDGSTLVPTALGPT